mmetsp:Transcript_113391/g.260124  ORF Transcript_113391/g.260124 Transcript_113391/m.260124 type:complete len:166 (+) Transcript_113391:56-553(+)
MPEPEVICRACPALDCLVLVVFVVAGGVFLFADFSFQPETQFMLNVFFLFIWTVDAATFCQLRCRKNDLRFHNMAAPFLKLFTLAAPSQILAICAVYFEDSGQILLMSGWACAFAVHFLMYTGDGGCFPWEGVVAVCVDVVMVFATKVWTIDGIGEVGRLEPDDS